MHILHNTERSPGLNKHKQLLLQSDTKGQTSSSEGSHLLQSSKTQTKNTEVKLQTPKIHVQSTIHGSRDTGWPSIVTCTLVCDLCASRQYKENSDIQPTPQAPSPFELDQP
jgi:hypothetical protein